MSAFDRLERMASRQQDRVYATKFELHPTRGSPNGRKVETPGEMWLGHGILDEEPTFIAIESGNRDRAGNDLRSLVTGADVTLSVDRAVYPKADAAKQGDRLLMADLRRFQITSTRRDGSARILFNLIELR